MTEDQIERRAEYKMDRLDRLFMNSHMTQEQYDTEVKRIDEWARDMLRNGEG